MDEKLAKMLENQLRARDIVCATRKEGRKFVVDIFSQYQEPIVIRIFHRQLDFGF